MARKPNYNFERMERERIKASKAAEKANAKREQRERDRAQSGGEARPRPTTTNKGGHADRDHLSTTKPWPSTARASRTARSRTAAWSTPAARCPSSRPAVSTDCEWKFDDAAARTLAQLKLIWGLGGKAPVQAMIKEITGASRG